MAFDPRQLRAMIGAKRATSALGILEHVSGFIHQQLLAGVDFDDLQSPFDGFRIGRPTRVRGYSERQVVDSSIRMLSAFGTRDTYNESVEAIQRNSVPTSQFIKSLRAVFARDDEQRRIRFNRRVQWPGTPEITVDYAHGQCLVQVTSLPQSPSHLIALQKEAESKILELDVATLLLRQDTAIVSPYLLINTESTLQPINAEARRLATELLDRLKFMSSQKEMRVLEARSPEDGAGLLEDLQVHIGPARVDTLRASLSA
ncbi:hypothetical protein WS62_29870 [Burkholderia sp. ABCPW 14]|nr:hypothetical protein WS62_29870 [Burkholderia sp. ABCPW 14]